MSKKNTLFNYFTKSPAPVSRETPSKTPKTSEDKCSSPPEKENIKNRSNIVPVTPKSAKITPKTEPRKRIISPKGDSDEELSEDEALSSGKKSKFSLPSDDSGDEYKPPKHVSSSEDEESGSESASEDMDGSEVDDSPSPKKQDKKRKRPTTTPSKPNKKGKMSLPFKTPPPKHLSNTSISSPSASGEASSAGGESDYNWSFLSYDFLKPEKIRDSKRRPPSDPDYDPRTLYVPDDFLRNQTPAMKQWWELKTKNYDCVLFFKVGKFYEFYHMDAVTGVKELSLTFMKGDYAHCGFPEIAYGRFASNLIDKGYKVARVEQTETPDMNAERCKKMAKPTKFDRVVSREICQRTTKGTQVYSVNDGACCIAENQYLLALAEKESDSVSSKFGVCFVDSSIGQFHIGEFYDDRHCSRLRTLFATYPPVQVLYERNRLSKRTMHVLNTALSSALKEALSPQTEFWSSNKTLTTLMEKDYFVDNKFPENLKKFIGEGSDSLGLTAGDHSELGVRALGAIVWYLTNCLLDHQLLSLGLFNEYVPSDLDVQPKTDLSAGPSFPNQYMILDAVTLKNLNILEDGAGGIQGTLLQKLDHCSSPFGKRLLHQWLCSPLTNINGIKSRQSAIAALKTDPDLVKEVRHLLTKVPDVERLIIRIHAQSKGLNDSHPDNRAILFEEKTYSKKKIMEFISLLNGIEFLQNIAKMVQEKDLGNESEVIKNCTSFVSDGGHFPDLTENLNFFKNAFDHDEAEKEGRILPAPGVDPEYDTVLESLEEIDKELKDYLKEQCNYFGVKVTYVGADKKRYQLEVPEAAASKKANSGYYLQGARKGFKKYYTDKCKELLERRMAAEDEKIRVLQDLRKRIFSRFSEKYTEWMAAVQCIAVLDVLMSFTEYVWSQNQDMCIPVFKAISEVEKPFVNLVDGRFPCVVGDDFIPNNTVLGQPSSLLLLTGPNMGGKSTLMRQLGLLVIMAQMGCYVPASSFELSLVDRIFTRIGASDDILAGNSTFFVEMSETSSILSHATKHSLVLVDELGRGTSTYDGTAIAAAVLQELTRMECRTIFSTHYHSLVEDFKDNSKILLGHMACMAESEEESEDGVQETVIFLYKLASGACPKSYGFNAARLAGIPAYITKVGSSKAKLFESEAINIKLFRSLMSAGNNIRQVFCAS